MNPTDRLTIVVPGDDPPQIQGSPHLERLKPYGNMTVYTDRPASLEEQIARVRDAEIVINSRGLVRWPGEVLRAMPKLRLISTCSIGTDNIDLAAAREMGITVSNQPGTTVPVVAEHAIALMMAVAKRAAFQTAAMKAGGWIKMDNVLLRGKTLGIIGAGNIGAEVARLARALGMETIAWTLHPSAERAHALGVRFVELDELLRTADVVSLHVRLSDDTRGLLGRRAFALMKPGTLLVNTARGALADTAALIEALHSGRLAGAALDVFDVEPLPPDHPLLQCEQVILTPHLADQTPEGADWLNAGAVENVIAFLEGRPRNVVV
jgi:D-3-phosphoglycerate dehydrogenase